MPDFPHLNLVQIIEKKAFIGHGGGPPKGQRAKNNLINRKEHYDNIVSQINSLNDAWTKEILSREENGLPPLSNSDIIPLFLQIDQAKDIESLKSFGIEIISQEEDGFVLGANADNFKALNLRFEQFLNQTNKKFKDSAAGLLEIVLDSEPRLKRILSSDLLSKWGEIESIAEIDVYIAISSYVKTPDYPTKGAKQSDESYAASIERFKRVYQEWQIRKDDVAMQRQTHLEENYINPYGAEFFGESQYIEFDDGFACKLRISGKGLKDLVLTNPFVFTIEEHDALTSYRGTDELEKLIELEVTAPEETDPKVCIIDSGIQEGHRLIAPAIDGKLSISYVDGDPDVFDKVSGGGHGTRVAGAALYPKGFDLFKNSVKAPFWLQNARILNDENKLLHSNEADLMRKITERFFPTKIYNLSVSREKPQIFSHMPIWAATIDKLIWENDILFIIAAGNISRSSNDIDIPGITNYLSSGINYPEYLKQEKSKITNPALSCFSITVGSICSEEFSYESLNSFGKENYPSSFSRSGLGLWGMIKPDVVEYGGDFVYDKVAKDVIQHEATSLKLIRSTRDNGPAIGQEVVGTSYSTPKVTHILAEIQKIFPAESSLLYRALVIQSARIPVQASNIADFIRHYGYGLPDLQRATENSKDRVTLYASGSVNPKNSNIYLIKLPKELNRPGKDYQVLIEITLSYKAEPRITRMYTNSYLSAWLDWETSRKGERLELFADRILAKENTEENVEQDEEVTSEEVVDSKSFKWTIGSKGKDGDLKGIKRQDNTVQKDWCIENSNELPDEFLIAVKGHKGWEKNLEKEIPYSIVVSFEIINSESDIDIYNLVRVENEIESEVRISV